MVFRPSAIRGLRRKRSFSTTILKGRDFLRAGRPDLQVWPTDVSTLSFQLSSRLRERMGQPGKLSGTRT